MKMKTRFRLIDQCRVYWNEFDPIGLINWDEDGFDDSEYNSYLWRTVELLHRGADKQEIKDYVEKCVYITMGFGKSAAMDRNIEGFVEKLLKGKWK